MRIKVLATALLLLTGFAAGAAADPAPLCGPAGVASSATEAGFLASLAEAPPALTEAGDGVVWTANGCTAENNCGDGNTVSCEGVSICQVTHYGVRCDSNEVYCPNFCSISQHCDCCDGPRTGTCFSKKGDCQETAEGIACDGRTFTCRLTCPFCQQW